jgi:Fe2+ transport system protein FeoA
MNQRQDKTIQDLIDSLDASTPVPLSELKDGERGWMRSAELCCEDCELLNAMGLTERCEIRVCQRSITGGPCIVQVNSTRLGLSAALARNIMVARA